ncbi:MAG: methylcobalamin:coenzyme M methyltransferase [Deltaproteobacteria bacterium ADurb.Bin135]|nr:MAG: methylcobalamin:coenzyme M methyltransferase [Deltaproteobacteria bacterium ADurb.Bin135]
MKPKEIIKKNLTFSDAPRFGLAFDRQRLNDFVFAGFSASASWKQRRWEENGVEYYDDEWGNIWHRIKNRSNIGEIYKPVLSDWEDLKNLKLPDLAAPERYQKAQQVFKQNQDLYHVGTLAFPFGICRYMRKMEIYFQDLYLERKKIDELHDRITSLLESVIEQYANIGADGIFFCEDWGLQNCLMIRPSLWREVFKPLYQRLCYKAHHHNLLVLMHSCGYIWEIMEDLAEVGINCFQFDQPELYGLEQLAVRLRELKVCLFSPVDIQKILPTGNKELIRKEAKKMVELFSRQNGAFIAKNYGDFVGIGIKPEWDQWAYEAFIEEIEKIE